MPVKFFELDTDEIIGTMPQSTTLADIEVEEGTIFFQNKKLERGTRLILTDNTLNNSYKKNCYDCILAKRIIKGKVISETKDVDEIPIYHYKVEKSYFNQYIPLFWGGKFKIYDYLILLIPLPLVIIFCRQYHK